MVCLICKRTENGLKEANMEEIANIENVLSIIQGKIDKINETPMEIPAIQVNCEITDENCSGNTGKHCINCGQSHSIDGAGYYWCDKYKLSVNVSRNENIKNKSINNILQEMKREINVLESQREKLENMKFISLEINNRNQYFYNEILSKYIPDIYKKFEDEKINICSDCYDVLGGIINSIVDDKISEMKDEIIEELREEMEDENDDE
jgi:ABC-type methionine transport system ATPase subunit